MKSTYNYIGVSAGLAPPEPKKARCLAFTGLAATNISSRGTLLIMQT